MRYLLGYDIGSSSVKAALLDIHSGKAVASATSPAIEMPITARQNGWAEQHPDMWWQELVTATQKLKANTNFAPTDIAAIGISYQMHGLVVVDKNFEVLRPAIIWCDSRAVGIGNTAFDDLGHDFCLKHLLNSPGNFTASKLRWVKENEPEIFAKIHKFMLPGDYIALKLSGQAQTTASGLSEGIFWDFVKQDLSDELLNHYGFDRSMVADIVPTFAPQSQVSASAAAILGIAEGTPICYRAGDQPNNALSLNVLNPGEVATTAGTSGVVYGVNDTAQFDAASRVNSFVHVNNQPDATRNGVLLCLNGTGILNSWLRKLVGNIDYNQMNVEAAKTPIGASGLTFLPFGNGAERIFENRILNAHLQGLDFNNHTSAHVFRAAQEGIVFGLNYGLGIMAQMGVQTHTVRAGAANMFLSPLFREAFANTTGAAIELYDTDGAVGAARGAGIGAGIYSMTSAFEGLEKKDEIIPNENLKSAYQEAYQYWVNCVNKTL